MQAQQPRKELRRTTSSRVRQEFSFRPPIRPFISSTFQDFQEERDFLVKKIFPQLDAICCNRGTYFAPVDLRWGINNSQVQSGQVIQLCLDYIIKCAPFFICILGERYGSHRGENAPCLPQNIKDLPSDASWLDVNLMVAASGGHEWVLEEDNPSCSITELEIMQAAFLNEDNTHCYFYIRQQGHLDLLHTDLTPEEREIKLELYKPEDEYSDLRVRDLKSRIIKHGLPVKYFKTTEQLGARVMEDWVKVIDLLCPPLEHFVPSESDLFSEWVAQESFCESRRRIFIKTPELEKFFHQLDAFASSSTHEYEGQDDSIQEYTFSSYLRRKKPVETKYQSVLLLEGGRGCGKTSALANWVAEFTSEHTGIKVLTHFVGSSARSYDITSCMRRFITKLRGDYYDEQDSDVCSSVSSTDLPDFHSLCESFIAAASLAPCVFVLDGVDELEGCLGLSPQQVKEMSWLPLPLPPQCKMIISTCKSDFSYRSLSKRPDTTVYCVPALTSSESKSKVVKERLAVYCKYLDDDMLARIVNCRLAEKPLFLSILTNELRVYGVCSKLDVYLESYLEAVSIRDLWSRVLQRWIKDYGWTTDPASSDAGSGSQELTGWVADALRLIAVSRCGLTQNEILTILQNMGYQGETEVTTFDWALLCSAAAGALLEKPGGLHGFFHQNLREAVEQTLFKSSEEPDPDPELFVSNRVPSRNPKQPLPPTDKSHFHGHLAKYFWSLPHSARRTSELPWQMERCKDTSGLLKVVTDPDVFLELCTEDPYRSKKLDLIHYWRVLQGEGCDLADGCWDMLSQVSQGQVLRTVAVEVGQEESGDEKEGPPQDAADINIPVITTNLIDSQNGSRKSSPTSLDKPLELEQLVVLMQATGQFLAEMGLFPDAEDILLQAHELLQQHYPLSMEQLHLRCHLEEIVAKQYLFQLRKDQAMRWFHSALRSTEDLIDDTLLEAGDIRKLQETKGYILDHLGSMKSHDRSYRKAEILLRKAKKCMDQVGSVPGTATVQYHIGVLRMYQHDYARAEQCLRQSLSIHERWFGKSHPEVASILNDLAGLLCNPNNQQSYDKVQAEHMYRRSLHIREKCLGKDHLLVATTLYHLGKLLKTQPSQPARSEALVFLRRALDIRTTKLGPDHDITRPVRKCLSQLEATIKHKKQGKSPDTRNVAQPYSSLSWREADLELKSSQLSNTPRAEAKSLGAGESRLSLGSVSTHTEVLSSVDENDYNDLIFDRKSLHSRGACNTHRSSEKGLVPGTVTSADESQFESLNGNIPHVTGDTVEELEQNATGDLPQYEPSQYDNHGESSQIVTPDGKSESQGPNRASLPQFKYLDNYAKEFSTSNKNFSKKNKHQTKRVISAKFRPKSAPAVKREDNPYQTFRIASSWHMSTSTHSTRITPRATSAPVHRVHRPGTPQQSPRTPQEGLHRQRCYTPTQHSIDIHNAYSVMGPNSAINSLLGEPPCPRRMHPELIHQSAWYHVPGRYRTVDHPYPPKRSQRRVASGHYSHRHQPGLNLLRSWPQHNGVAPV